MKSVRSVGALALTECRPSVRSVGALALTCGFRDALRRLNPFGRSKSEEVRQKWEELQRSPDALARRVGAASRLMFPRFAVFE
jgi:hypothetical protein